MASNLKRKRAAVSYKEPSSDTEEFSSDSEADYSPKKGKKGKKTVPQRRSTRHAQPSPAAEASTSAPRHPRVIPTPQRSRRGRIQSYRESSGEESEEPDAEFEEEREDQEHADHSVPARERTGRPRKQKKRKGGPGRPKALGAPLKRNEPKTKTPVELISDGKIPEWASLPYHVLLQVFVYASYPVQEENIPWLVKMARMCSAFTKPALTALYRNPPIFAIRKNRGKLVHHLISPPADVLHDPRIMVKRLELDATRMSALTEPGSSAADLISLVSSLTNVKDIDIFDPIDRPPYRSRIRRIRRWDYPAELFAALEQHKIRLHSWRWTSAFCSQGFLWMKDIHTKDSFQTLRDVTLARFESVATKQDGDGQPTSEELLASALAVLPKMRSLTLESCLLVNERLLPLLPTNLKSINFTNCKNLTSDALNAFLVTHGTHLEELVLDHNQSLDLSFLVDLKVSCPRLELLKMDLNYFNTLHLTHDSDPNYDELLKEGEIPSWPSTLQVIDLEYLRKWTPDAAKAFFSSLIDSAEELPSLQEISLSAMVDIDWRERAAFRSEWTARFQKVFAKKMVSPSAQLVSLRAFRKWKAAQEPVEEKNDSFMTDDSDAPLLPIRKRRQSEQWDTKRLRSRTRPSTSQGETTSGEDEVDAETPFIQGKCHRVEIRLDNLRPREFIQNEEDFLDAEVSGDEDWNGNDVDDDRYAW